MDEKTAFRHELISAWCGPAFLISFIIFWVILGQNFPNPSPALTADALQARYAENLGSIRLGFIISMIIVVFYLPWTALLSTQMARIEGRFPVMAYLQLLGGGLTVMVVSFSAFFWVAAAFRPDQDPATTQMLTDLGWLCIDLQYACTTLQMIAAALVGLADKREVPLFPRWACYVTIWCGLSFLPASLTGVLKTGPFAWDGILSYYIPYACWLGWYTIASTYMIKEVNRRIKASEGAAVTSPSLSRA
ncbi:MAG: hypothetical protein P1U47_00310 [Zhongshania sp.]|uniref:hypothetical protein n=1 Tax=Zhongshania sp. TaxID=1971902 RepID=UPI00262A0373|nr:hypothetical protein [Zhongshania sp.]MDF1690784.1 hypothetical protein [Zhongshania sp.]